MSIPAGTRLGRYEIRSKLGEGGMGEVYRATDSRLRRDVAIKVLPAAFSTDAERLRRFEHEAQAAGALNHPNIVAIHDVSTHDDRPYVVSELLEGSTLREHLVSGSLPARKTADYALQIARGLAAAHSKGIVHRDLKPENVFVTTEGRVKILDFGIAKLAEPARSHPQHDVPTVRLVTEPGVMLGTASYMSPEQARGEAVDHRSDIFSFGCVLYEMLAGRRPFTGDSTIEVLNAILKEEPADIAAPGTQIPLALERIARRCLEKSPSQRFQSASDLTFALESLVDFQSGSQAAVVGAQRMAGGWRARVAWLGAGALVASLGAAVVFLMAAYSRRPTSDENVVRLSISVPEKMSFNFSVEEQNLSVSPDGRHVVFVAEIEGRGMLWVRPLGALTPKALPGTEGASSPFWSPDSRYVAFFADGKLKRVESSGASLQTLCSLSSKGRARGTWGRAGTIIFSQMDVGNFRVPAEGGTPTPLTKTAGQRAWYQFLPDGRRFIYYDYEDPARDDDGGIYSGSLDSSETKLLMTTPPARPQYVAAGYLLYPREGSLVARRFDETNLRLSGEGSVIVDSIPYFDKTGWAEFSASDTGILVYLTGFPKSHLVWRDRDGREIGRVGDPTDMTHIELSPDMRRLALTICDIQDTSGCDIWIQDLTRNTRTRFVSGPTDDGAPRWSPDGRRLAYFSCCENKSPLHIKELSDTGKGQTPLAAGFPHTPWDWSADGRFILYSERHRTTGRDVWVLSLSGDGKPYPLLQTQYGEREARLSPDGRWVLYVSDEAGTSEVYVARFDRPGEKWRVSTTGGTQPRWIRNGRELFYRAADNTLMAVKVKTADTFEVSALEPLFQIHPGSGYDVTADGQRFLVQVPDATFQSPFAAVLNWMADVKQ